MGDINLIAGSKRLESRDALRWAASVQAEKGSAETHGPHMGEGVGGRPPSPHALL